MKRDALGLFVIVCTTLGDLRGIASGMCRGTRKGGDRYPKSGFRLEEEGKGRASDQLPEVKRDGVVG